MRVITTILIAAGVLALSACAAPPQFKEHVYPAWGFAVSWRGPPKERDFPAAADGTRGHSIFIETVQGGHDDVVNVIDATGSTKPDDQILADTPAWIAGNVDGTIGPVTYAATGKVIGREFTIQRPGRPLARARVFVANKHVYQLISESPRGPDDPESMTFLTSFRLLPAG
jgi:hypothetical protein